MSFYIVPGYSEDDGEHRTSSDFASASGFEELDAQVAFPHFVEHFNDELREFVRSKSALESGSDHQKTSHDLLYQPTADYEVRVLILDAGLEGDPLRGRLEQVSVEFEHKPQVDLDYASSDSASKLMVSRETNFAVSPRMGKKLPYTAVSYCWGTSEFALHLEISGHKVGITSTVDTILRSLRQPDRSINLWIDQICINQSDTADKEVQVKVMGLIYKRARNTIIWLGAEPERGAFRAMQGLHEVSVGRDDDLLEEELEYLRKPLNEDPIVFQTLEALFQRPWFQRTWVIQEAVLSQHPYFMAGAATVSWEDFAGYCVSTRGLELFPSMTSSSGRVVKPGSAILAEIYLARSYFWGFKEAQILLSWLVDTRYAAVTLPIDKVFGILGLCQSSIIPDYNKSKEEVFREVTILAAQENGGLEDKRWLNVLSCVDHDIRSGPSWVPDWAQPRLTSALAFDTSAMGLYQAGGTSRENAFTLRQDKSVLEATTILVATITELSEIFHEADITTHDILAANASLRQSINFVLNCQTDNPELVTSFESICATLVAGKDGPGKSRYPNDYIEILSLLCDETMGRSPSLTGQTYTARQRHGHFKLDQLSRRKPGRMFQNLKKAYRKAILHRRLCWTSRGHLGLVPRFAREGDHVVIFPGQSIPFILRHKEAERYVVVGECYMHELMDGSCAEEMATSAKVVDIV